MTESYTEAWIRAVLHKTAWNKLLTYTAQTNLRITVKEAGGERSTDVSTYIKFEKPWDGRQHQPLGRSLSQLR